MLKQYLAFSGITIIAFIAFLEYMVVNNALPSIQDVFHISILMLQWVSNVYSIILATTMILFGRFGDIFGYRKIFYLGILALIIGSFGAGYTNIFDLLIFFRGIQSLGIAMIIVIAPGLIQLIFQGNSHTAMSIYATLTGLGLIIGPYLGGIIVMHLGWQWIFYINIPLLIIAFMLCLPFVPEFRVKIPGVTLDWVGNILLVISLTSLIYALVRQQQIGLDLFTIINLAIFIVSTPILIYVEMGKEFPILNFSFFKQPDFALAALSNAMAGALVCCGMFFSPIFLQKVIHFSPKDAGTVLLAFAFGTVVFSPIIGRVVKKIHERKTIMIGLSCGLAASVMYMAFFYFASITFAVVAFCLTGMSLAVNNVASAISAIKAVGEKNAGVAIGTIFGIFNIIAAIMLALTSVLLHIVINFNLAATEMAGAKLAYTLVFLLVAIYAVILFLIGLKTSKKALVKIS